MQCDSSTQMLWHWLSALYELISLTKPGPYGKPVATSYIVTTQSLDTVTLKSYFWRVCVGGMFSFFLFWKIAATKGIHFLDSPNSSISVYPQLPHPSGKNMNSCPVSLLFSSWNGYTSYLENCKAKCQMVVITGIICAAWILLEEAASSNWQLLPSY